MNDSKRLYLRDVLPRLYQETEAWLQAEMPELLSQLPHLYITDRCTCGQCSDFHMDSDLQELSMANGSVLLFRPLYFDMYPQCHFMLGLSGKLGLTEGEHDKSYISDYELIGRDYPDNYIHKQLEAHGFKREKKQKKVRRSSSTKRRGSMKLIPLDK